MEYETGWKYRVWNEDMDTEWSIDSSGTRWARGVIADLVFFILNQVSSGRINTIRRERANSDIYKSRLRIEAG